MTGRYRMRQNVRIVDARIHRVHCRRWWDSVSGYTGMLTAVGWWTARPWQSANMVSAVSSPSVTGTPKNVSPR